MKSARKKTELHAVSLVTGDELLLLNELRDELRKKAKAAGFDERESWIVDSGFNWNHFSESLQNLSLFSNKTLVELQFQNVKWDDKALKFLLSYLEAPSSHKQLIIYMPKLTSSHQKSRWYQALAKKATIHTIRPIYSNELPQWIKKRLSSFGLTADNDSIRLLVESTEGHLLATQQAIEKLAILYPKKSISMNEMANVISHQSRYTIFDLTTAALQGKGVKVMSILKSLRTDGVEPVLILWSYLQELRRLANIGAQIQQGKSLQEALQHEWSSRKILLQQAFSRHTLNSLQQLMLFASRIDMTIKGAMTGNVWNELEKMGIRLAGYNFDRGISW